MVADKLTKHRSRVDQTAFDRVVKHQGLFFRYEDNNLLSVHNRQNGTEGFEVT